MSTIAIKIKPTETQTYTSQRISATIVKPLIGSLLYIENKKNNTTACYVVTGINTKNSIIHRISCQEVIDLSDGEATYIKSPTPHVRVLNNFGRWFNNEEQKKYNFYWNELKVEDKKNLFEEF